MYNSENFYMGTEASWNDAEAPEREADYVSDSGSAYWYTESGVFRKSNHWGYRASSRPPCQARCVYVRGRS